MPFTLHDWFCMKEGRDSFRPRLPADSNFIFCHDHVLQDEVLNSIQRSFATNEPIKMLLYGDWGVGKTHLTYHICWWLREHQDEYPAYPVLIEIGDITKKSRFDEVIRPFLDKLGLDFLVQLVSDYRGKEPNVSQGLRNAGVSSHIADTYAKILLTSPGQTPVPIVIDAFEYLKGRSLGSGGSNAGFGRPLDQSRDFYDVLLGLGTMFLAVYGHRMLFIADEAAKLEAVEADDATQSHWVNVHKLIFDDANDRFGFIYTISGVRESDLPRALFERQIRNRLGPNQFQLQNLAPRDVAGYVRRLVEAFIDREKVEALVSAGEIDASEYDPDAYPFTAGARHEFEEYFDQNQQDAKPRDISRSIDELAFIAGKLQKRLIDSECLRRMNM